MAPLLSADLLFPAEPRTRDIARSLYAGADYGIDVACAIATCTTLATGAGRCDRIDFVTKASCAC